MKPGDAEGTFDMNTTMGTPAMRLDLLLQTRVRHQGVVHTIYSPSITIDIVEGYSLGSPADHVSVLRGAGFEISGSFQREPEFGAAVVVEAVNLPVGAVCEPQRIEDSPDRYSLACGAGSDVEAGEYLVEVTPRSVLAGDDGESVPYNIPPVEAVLVVEAGDTLVANQPL